MKQYVFTPGPVPVPSDVLVEMAKPIIHHRTKEFESIVEEVRKGLKYIYQTDQEVFILASSGTGAMEAAVANTMSTGDKVLVVNGGKFGERWTKIAKAYGLEVQEISVEWGKAVDPSSIKEALDNDPSIKAVLLQASETSTGVMHPTEEIAKITNVREDVLLLVDGITAVGVFPLNFDRLGIDVLVGGSQKAFMMPPGLAFIALSKKAWKFNETSDLPKFYFDLKSYQKSASNNTTPWTPAVTLIIGLVKVLKNFSSEGLENMYKRHENLSCASREALIAMNIELFAKDSPSTALTVGIAPREIGAAKIIKELKNNFGMTIAGGQDHAKGKIFRFSHIGDIETTDTIAIISALESTLKKLGHSFNFGAGVTKATEILGS